MKRLVVAVIVVCALVWAFRWWEAQPAPEPPATVWTSIPFRGPAVFVEPGKGAPIDDILVALSPDPLLEAPQTIPSPHVFLRQPTTWVHSFAESMSWRRPFTTIDKMSPADRAAWGVRTYTFTGTTQRVGSKMWAQYAVDVPQSLAAR